jgi:hypothetical protein
MLEIVKLLATLVGGGLAGALFTEWLRRRRSKVRLIPLIERVNRQVSPELQGITLARIVGTSTNRKLEELKNLREYQLTMRNTSPIHLQDAEVQFEFPADDVQAWASRPSLSKTSLVEVDAAASPPWRKAFRWKIPHLPSGDSVEFTFRAVDPSSDSYEAALYHSEGVVFERIVGEPLRRADVPGFVGQLGQVVAGVAAGALMAATVSSLWSPKVNVSRIPTERFNPAPPDQITAIKLGGCNLRVSSSTYQMHDGVWLTTTFVLNLGAQTCVIQSNELNLVNPLTVDPNDLREPRRFFSEKEPRIADAGISVHAPSTPPATTTAPVYVLP